MKTSLLIGSVMALAAVLPFQASAASVTVGSMDSGNCYPFNCNDSGTSVGPSIHYQQVYSSAAFSGPISISSIGFQSLPGFPFEVLTGDYNISFSTTAAAVGSLDPTFANNVGGDSATFFNATITGGLIGATYTISGTPFSYDPMNGNLLMDVQVSNQDLVPNGGGNGYFWADYTGTLTQRNYVLGGGGAGAGSDLGALVTTFNVPEPTQFAAVFASLGLAWAGWRRQRRA